MLSTFLASTPLLSEAWRLCSVANTSAPMRFVTELIGEVGYVAFSGIQMVEGSEPASCRELVPLESAGGVIGDLFSPLLSARKEDEEPIMVHGGLLKLFFGCQIFRDQVSFFSIE